MLAGDRAGGGAACGGVVSSGASLAFTSAAGVVAVESAAAVVVVGAVGAVAWSASDFCTQVFNSAVTARCAAQLKKEGSPLGDQNELRAAAEAIDQPGVAGQRDEHDQAARNRSGHSQARSSVESQLDRHLRVWSKRPSWIDKPEPPTMVAGDQDEHVDPAVVGNAGGTMGKVAGAVVGVGAAGPKACLKRLELARLRSPSCPTTTMPRRRSPRYERKTSHLLRSFAKLSHFRENDPFGGWLTGPGAPVRRSRAVSRRSGAALIREHFVREFSCVGGVDDREGRLGEPRRRVPGGRDEARNPHGRYFRCWQSAARPSPQARSRRIAPILQRARSSSRKFRCRCRRRNHRRRLPSSPRLARHRLLWSPRLAHNHLRSRPRRVRIQHRRRSSSRRQRPRRHRPKTRPQRLAPAMSGPQGTGGGTACNTYGSPAAMSFRRRRSRAGRRDIGSKARTGGSGFPATGTEPF